MSTLPLQRADLRHTPFPFEIARLPAAKLARLDAALAAWCERHALGDDSFRHVASAYVDFCAPRDAPDTGVTLLAHFVACFFAFNDITSDTTRLEALKSGRAALAAVGSADLPEAAATAELRALVIRTWGEAKAARLLRSIDQMLGAFEWEVGKTSLPISTAEYLRNREHTIGNYPFIELWRLSLEADPSPEAWAQVESLERLATRLVFTTNDLLSIERDQRKKKLNLVLLLAREQQLSTEEASERISAEFWTLLDHFTEEWHRTRALMHDRPSLVYVDYLAALLEGNRAATAALTDRFWGNG